MRVCVNNINISIKSDERKSLIKHLEKIGIKKENIKEIYYQKKSIDSRKKNDIKFVFNIEVELKNDINIDKINGVSLAKELKLPKRESKKLEGRVVVIGTGPAGLFAALRLCQYGYKPVIFERGNEVDKRDKDVERFNTLGVLNTNSNIQFGEGGAGTYSDGKLNTRVKSEYMQFVFEELIKNGAQEEIIYDYKPHIGTDILKVVVKNMREKIKTMGGEFRFSEQITDFKKTGNKITKIQVNNREWQDVDHLVLGIGHSARDTYRALNEIGVAMEAKDFAIGARIEHPRRDIDKMQFGKSAGDKKLGSASYNLTYNNRDEKRGVFSFCMCPGGEIVNASSEEGGSLVNGMSYSTRDGEFSNSAVVVALRREDFGNNLFDALKFQEGLEQKAYNIMGKHGALYQKLSDFRKGKKSSEKIKSSYQMDLVSHDLNEFFPEVITKNMHMAFDYWSKNTYFVSERANLIGPETRTSAPLRIVRDGEGRSTNIENLYPIGEGAGYAGGITSAAIDGVKIIDLAFAKTID